MRNGHDINVEDEEDAISNPHSMQNVDLNITKNEEAEKMADTSNIEIKV